MSDGLKQRLVCWDDIVLALATVSRIRSVFGTKKIGLPSQVHQTDRSTTLVKCSHSHGQHEACYDNLTQCRLHCVKAVLGRFGAVVAQVCGDLGISL